MQIIYLSKILSANSYATFLDESGLITFFGSSPKLLPSDLTKPGKLGGV